MRRVCVCGKPFRTTQSRIDDGGGKFCSRKCAYANRVRPSGLTYDIKVENPAWFKAGEENPDWKGDGVSYRRLHKWVQDSRGLASEYLCYHCNEADAVDWANVSHNYYRNLDDFMPLCRMCHSTYDRKNRDENNRQSGDEE